MYRVVGYSFCIGFETDFETRVQMMRTTNYLIYRHGSNSANQSMTNKMAIAIMPAVSKDAAIWRAGAYHTVYGNQFLSAVPESKANREDWNAVSFEQSVLA